MHNRSHHIAIDPIGIPLDGMTHLNINTNTRTLDAGASHRQPISALLFSYLRKWNPFSWKILVAQESSHTHPWFTGNYSSIVEWFWSESDHDDKLTVFEPIHETITTRKTVLHKTNMYDIVNRQFTTCSVTLCTIIITVICSILHWHGLLDYNGSSTNRLYFGGEYRGYLLAPFIFKFGQEQFWIRMLSFGLLFLLELSLSPTFKSVLRFRYVFVVLLVATSAWRFLLGYIFSRGLGWACPSLFFNESMHESSEGLLPFLWGLMMLQWLRSGDRYLVILISKIEGRTFILSIKKCYAHLILLCAPLGTLCRWWWYTSGWMIGTFFLLIFMIFSYSENNIHLPEIRAQFFRKGWTKNVYIFSLVVFQALMLSSIAHQEQKYLPNNREIAGIASETDDYLATFLVMTAPRPGHPLNLLDTIQSYIENFPSNRSDPLFNRFQLVVYTHFTNHPVFDLAKERFSTHRHGHLVIKWIKRAGSTFDQPMHFSKAIKEVSEIANSRYIALIEDDFPLCKGQWPYLWQSVYKSYQDHPDHCSVFVGTGGSGLIFKSSLASTVSSLLIRDRHLYPTDLIMQQCFRGKIDQCQGCQMTISKTLLMYHTGYNTSTSLDRVYDSSEFQCGWRHPFNGELDVSVV